MFAAGLMLGERPLFRVFINSSRTTPWVLTAEAPEVTLGGLGLGALALALAAAAMILLRRRRATF